MFENTNKSIIYADLVTLCYQSTTPVLSNISLNLPPRSFHFVTGSSGSGKSSLLKLFYLSLKPVKGIYRIFEKDIYKLKADEIQEIRRKIGVVFQDFRLFNHLTAFENVALPLSIFGVKPKEIETQVKELLNWVGLAHQMNAYPHSLSGGEQQRVAIARAVITRPDLLLADEPTGNVDDAMAIRIIKLFEELNKLGTTIVIATHNDALVSRFPYPRLHLENGRIIPLQGTNNQDLNWSKRHAQEASIIF